MYPPGTTRAGSHAGVVLDWGTIRAAHTTVLAT